MSTVLYFVVGTSRTELAATGPAQVVFLLVSGLGLIGLGYLIKRKVA